LNKVLWLFVLVSLVSLSACEKNHEARAPVVPSTSISPTPAAAIYLSDAEIQLETPEQRELLHKALGDMLSFSSEDLRQARYGPSSKTLGEVLRAHLVPTKPVPVTDEDFYTQASDANVRKAIQSLNSQITKEQ
jgi:hypothetical protein